MAVSLVCHSQLLVEIFMAVSSRRRTHHKKGKQIFCVNSERDLSQINICVLCSQRSASSTVFFLLQTPSTTFVKVYNIKGKETCKIIIYKCVPPHKSHIPILTPTHPSFHRSSLFPSSLLYPLYDYRRRKRVKEWNYMIMAREICESYSFQIYPSTYIPRPTHPVIHRPS